MNIPDREYQELKSAIETANQYEDREALRRIKMQIVSKYGTDDRDPRYLLNLFRYTV